MTRFAAAVLLLVPLGLASCGGDKEPPAASTAPPPWAQVAPEQIAEAKKHGVPVAFENDLGMRFVLIPAGTFVMGSAEGTPPQNRNAPQHEVTLTRPFYLQVMEVTNEAYRRHRPDHDAEELTRSGDKSPGNMRSFRNDSLRRVTTFGGYDYGPELNEDRQPVTCVSWHDAEGFAAWMSNQGSGRSYRLPTEAEWEHACRAGTRAKYAFGDTLTPTQAIFRPDRGPDHRRVNGPAEVGGYEPNAWGLWDMHGNVFEWCADWFSEYSPDSAETPKGPQEGRRKIIRGGSAQTERRHVGSAERWARPPDYRTGWGWVGFRLVSPLPEPGK